jgi:hypothetical protein
VAEREICGGTGFDERSEPVGSPLVRFLKVAYVSIPPILTAPEDQARFLRRQLSLPISMMLQLWIRRRWTARAMQGPTRPPLSLPAFNVDP